MDAGRETEQQTRDRGDTERCARAAGESADAAVGEKESQLLQREPHEREVQDADGIRTRHDAHGVHRYSRSDE